MTLILNGFTSAPGVKRGITPQLVEWVESQNFLKWKEASELLGRGYERQM
jgi:hypothetical protein